MPLYVVKLAQIDSQNASGIINPMKEERSLFVEFSLAVIDGAIFADIKVPLDKLRAVITNLITAVDAFTDAERNGRATTLLRLEEYRC